MNNEQTQVQDTQHAFLVAWGWFADSIGLIQSVQQVHLHQKKYRHTPQTKVLELLVATLAGLEHLQDISLSAHPLDKDPAVAMAWGQPAWADYTGVSRALSALNWEEAHAVVRMLDQVSQPLIQSEPEPLRGQRQRLRFDGDLTGLPVSNTSRTYPNAALGHMDDEIRLGYQAAVVSMQSRTYQHLWLSTAHHPGDTVSCTQAEALVQAAEGRTGLRPRRRTDLLQQRMATTQQRLRKQQEALYQAHDRLTEARHEAQERHVTLAELEEYYHGRQRPERPNSQLSVARKRLNAAQQRTRSRDRTLQSAQRQLAKSQAHWSEQQETLSRLQQRLARFEQENAANPALIGAEFRLDAGLAPMRT